MNFFRLVLLALLLVARPAFSETVVGEVVKVKDGDTVVLRHDGIDVDIRLAGIDTPEKKQAFGKDATRNLVRLVQGKEVTADCGKTDRHKRRVCVLFVNGVDVNLEQVKAGWAWHYKKYQNEQSPKDRMLYGDAEEQARAEKIGLWSIGEAVPPWEWRHRKK